VAPNADTYVAIDLYKNVYPKYVFLGWYYVGGKPDERIKSIFEAIKVNLPSKFLLQLDFTLLSQGIVHSEDWNLYSLEKSSWKRIPFTINTSEHLVSACLNEMALVSTGSPEERK
jgi:hypothetical protein